MGSILAIIIIVGSFHYQEWKHKRELAECRACKAPAECGESVGWLEPECERFVGTVGCYDPIHWKK